MERDGLTRAELKKLLPAPDRDTQEFDEAHAFMKNKGFPDVVPFAVAFAGGATYFYYELPNTAISSMWDLLELEVSRADDNSWQRKVTCYRERAA